MRRKNNFQDRTEIEKCFFEKLKKHAPRFPELQGLVRQYLDTPYDYTIVQKIIAQSWAMYWCAEDNGELKGCTNNYYSYVAVPYACSVAVDPQLSE